MTKTVLLAPIGTGVGLYTVSLGLVRSMEDQGIKVSFVTPFAHGKSNDEEVDDSLLNNFSKPLPTSFIDYLFSRREEEKIIEFVLGYTKHHAKESDVILVQGLAYKIGINTFATSLNHQIASALSAHLILVTKARGTSKQKLYEQIKIEADSFGVRTNHKFLGCIINKIGAPIDSYGNTRIDLFDPPKDLSISTNSYEDSPIKILGAIPWKRKLMAIDVQGIAKHLSADILNKDTFKNNLIQHFALIAAGIDVVTKVIKPGVMLITSGDRSDVIIAASMAYLNGMGIAGLILTGDHKPNKETLHLCNTAIETGFPILLTKTDSLRTSISLQNISTDINTKEESQIEDIKQYIAGKIDLNWAEMLQTSNLEFTMSPAAFRFSLMEKARALKKTIVLPESSDPRILNAANFCSKKEIAKIILLGDKKTIEKTCLQNAITLNENIEIRDPKQIADKYVTPLLEIRKHKGLTEDNAKEYLLDPIVVATMMLHRGEVDGLVAGANTTTANVVSPALKILKTAKDAKLVSSVFFMCMESEVLVYGDCAINLNPTAEELADIAIQSADSAKKFNIDPKIAMISYSTGTSGKGVEVEKVRKATELVKAMRPDLLVDGPLQYDAAKVPEVAKIKAPNSPVAGKATVFIFPDLNTANTTYKAVQRTAGVLSIGPMLQGLSKPVNDLSRGATVDDIVFTILITAIQD